VGIKIFAVAFAAVSLYWLVLRFRRTRRFTIELLAWLVVFAGVGTVVFVPHATDQMAAWLGVSSGFNALTFITVTMLILVVFRILSRLQKVERDMTSLIRAYAIEMATEVKAKHAANEPKPGDSAGS
jgi:hypothetical protein